MKLEAMVLPVSDVDRAKRFYGSLGHHGAYEATAPKHHWSGWYAAYIIAREQGRTAEEAAKDGALHMEAARG
jgi:catechol 2,3-dioxygenase-like lactoylglutathione lyase family enzyme